MANGFNNTINTEPNITFRDSSRDFGYEKRINHFCKTRIWWRYGYKTTKMDTGDFVTKNEQLRRLASEAGRFVEPPTVEEEVAQIGKMSKLIRDLNYPKFDPVNEAEMEEYLDNVAPQTRRLRVCVAVFREAWASAATTTMAAEIRKAEGDSIEEIASVVARNLFPLDMYVQKLEDELLMPQRLGTVQETERTLKRSCERYVRLCRRRGRSFTLSDERLKLCVTEMTPLRVAQDTRLLLPIKYTVEEFLDKARVVELEEIRRRKENGNTAVSVYPVEPTPKDSVRKCFGCNSTGHFKKDCPHKSTKCSNCEKIGHTGEACKGWIRKDNQGRVRSSVEVKRNKVVLEQATDGTIKDKLLTANDVLLEFIRKNEARGESSKKNYQQKKTPKENLTRTSKRARPTYLAEPKQIPEEDVTEVLTALAALMDD